LSIGTFGPVTFEVSTQKTRTFDDFNRKTSAKFEQHDIIGIKPKLEFVAPGLDEISFQVIFSAFHGLNPLNEANQLRSIVQKGEYHSLVIGGKVLGNFVIENISEAWKYVDGRGNVLYIAVDVSLKEYT
jgi:phage protein U